MSSCKEFKDKKHFTLLELILVVVIIAILAAIAMPLYYKAITKSVVSKAKHGINLVAQAEKLLKTEAGVYASVAAGQVDPTIGEPVTGVNLKDLDTDIEWTFTVDVGASNIIIARKKRNPYSGSTVTYNLDNGIMTVAPELN